MAKFVESEDGITDFTLTDDKTKLLATSSDGYLAVFDIRVSGDQSSDSYATSHSNPSGDFKPDLYALSDNQEDELTGVCIVKNGKKVVTCSNLGIVSLWNYDWFGDCNDRMQGHTSSIGCMVKYDEDTVLTGCDDGYVRAVNILPNKVISVVNDDMFDTEEPMPVSKIAHNGRFCGIVCNDTMVQIYSIQSLEDRYVEEYDEDDEENIKKAEANMQGRQLLNDGDEQMEVNDGMYLTF